MFLSVGNLVVNSNLLEFVECFRSLLVFKGEEEFKGVLDRLVNMIKERAIPREIIGEVIAAFIVERCDNMLANVSFGCEMRNMIYELAREALCLYVYFKLLQSISSLEEFTELKLVGNINIKASNEQELIEKLKASGMLRRVLREEAMKMIELFSHVVIKRKEELERLLDMLMMALNKGLVSLLILPRFSDNILFFKEYYYQYKTDIDKIRMTLRALYEILNNKELLNYIDCEKVKDILDKLNKLLEYVSYDKLQDEYLDIEVKVKKNGTFHYEVRYCDKVLREGDEWPSLRELLREVGFRDTEADKIINDLYSGILDKPYTERSYVKKLKCPEKLKLKLLEDTEVKAGNDVDDLIEAIKAVVEKREDIVRVTIRDKVVVVKSPFKSFYWSEGLVIEVHMKSNGTVMELVIPGKRTYHVPYQQLQTRIPHIMEDLFQYL